MEPLCSLVSKYKKARNDRALSIADEFLKIVGPKLRGYIATKFVPHDGDDVFQATLIGIARGLMYLRVKSDRQVWAWCFQITKRKMIDHWRRVQTDEVDLLETDALWRAVEASAEKRSLDITERDDLKHAMRLLGAAKASCIDYLWESLVLGLDWATMGEIYNLSRNTIRMRTERCLTLVRELVERSSNL